MDKRGKRQAAPIFGGMGFYIALLVCVVAAGVVGYYALLSDGEISNEMNDGGTQVVDQTDDGVIVGGDAAQLEDDKQQVISQTPVVVPQTVTKSDKPDIPDADETGGDSAESDIPVSGEIVVPNTTTQAETPAPQIERIVAPLLGSTVSVFSADKLMYDATLDDWRTHDGIDICAEAGTQVVAAASGTVIAVAEDDRLGVNIRIEHANGYVTTYASLHPETFVSAGDKVNAGDAIGTVGNTSLTEAALGAHLHFSVTRNGQLIDPAAYLPKEE